MKTYQLLFLSIFLLLLCSSCRESDSELLNNEDLLSQYSQSQVKMAIELDQLSLHAARMTRMLPIRESNYIEVIKEGDAFRIANSFWSSSIPELKRLIHFAEEKEAYFISGSSKIMLSYVYQTAIDQFGGETFESILKGATSRLVSPSSEGFRPDSNYYYSIEVLDEGIMDLENSTETIDQDRFYNGNAQKWIRLANSLKLRAYNNLRLVDPTAKDKINQLLLEGNLMEDISEDWEYKYQTQAKTSIYRFDRPFLLEESYGSSPSAYLSNYYMWLIVGEKPLADPRRAFYFYRQIGDFNDPQKTANCADGGQFDPSTLFANRPAHFSEIDPNMPYCVANLEGYFGRDHGTALGELPDRLVKTQLGIYPFGGIFDKNRFEAGMFSNTAPSESRLPFLLSSYLYFIRAEAALSLGTVDNAADMMEKGIRSSFAKVKSLRIPEDSEVKPSSLHELLADLEAEEEAYIAYVLDQFNAAISEEEKLDVLMKEYFIALWGNGMEAYNNYRRTAKPDNIQPLVDESLNHRLSFPRRLMRDPGFVSSLVPYENEPVFWDTNDASLFR